jgi:hypothetical protein
LDLVEIERIKQLKYTYFKAVDTKDWTLFRSCFSEDAESSYENGTLTWSGLDAIVDGLRPLIGRPTLLTQHQGHHPIIELTSETTAKGSWYLQDICYERRENWWFHGTAYYADEYVKLDENWKIRRIGFERVFLIRESPLPAGMKVEFDRFDQGLADWTDDLQSRT